MAESIEVSRHAKITILNCWIIPAASANASVIHVSNFILMSSDRCEMKEHQDWNKNYNSLKNPGKYWEANCCQICWNSSGNKFSLVMNYALIFIFTYLLPSLINAMAITILFLKTKTNKRMTASTIERAMRIYSHVSDFTKYEFKSDLRLGCKL